MQRILYQSTFFLKLAVTIILAMHSIPTMLDGSITYFGDYLAQTGFGRLGLPLAWVIKLTHLVSIPFFFIDKYVKLFSAANIAILVAGIFMVHLPHGWFVVGKGTNGIEFNVLLIAALLTIMFPKGVTKQ